MSRLEIAKGVGLSLDELISLVKKNSKKEPKKVVKPKYRNNKTNPDRTWTGRGKHPKWLVNELANGKTFLIF